MTLNRPEWNFTHNVYATVDHIGYTLSVLDHQSIFAYKEGAFFAS